MTRDAWNPEQYERFHDERRAPFFDLLALVRPQPRLRGLDLGCGTGELTQQLHQQLHCETTLGIDSSPAMLAKATPLSGSGLGFEPGDIGSFTSARPFDLVFSNAALQWLPEHARLFERLLALVAPSGQLAVQMPSNHDYASHVVAQEVAQQEPFRSALAGYVRQSPVLSAEAYAELLYGLGFKEQSVRLQVYAHVLPAARGVIEWVKGTLLTDYERRLPAALFAEFLTAYSAALLARLSKNEPFFYPFKRLLLWARR